MALIQDEAIKQWRAMEKAHEQSRNAYKKLHQAAKAKEDREEEQKISSILRDFFGERVG